MKETRTWIDRQTGGIYFNKMARMVVLIADKLQISGLLSLIEQHTHTRLNLNRSSEVHLLVLHTKRSF